MSVAKAGDFASLSPSRRAGWTGQAVSHRFTAWRLMPMSLSHCRPVNLSRSTLALSLAVATQTALSAPPMPPALSDLSARIQASLELPGTRVQMLDLDGQSIYLAGGGRYAFTGPAWDLWHGVELQDVAQASDLAGRLDRERLPLDAVDLGALPMHTDVMADDSLWVFVDPLDSAGLELLAELQAQAISTQVVVLPVGGPESLNAARRLRCADCLCLASSGDALTALISREIATLPTPIDDCDTQPLVRALITARLLGVEQVPLLIAPDGRLQQGVPADLAAWLGEGDAG